MTNTLPLKIINFLLVIEKSGDSTEEDEKSIQQGDDNDEENDTTVNQNGNQVHQQSAKQLPTYYSTN